MILRISSHKAPSFCVPNIFPPYRGPSSVAQELALALTRELALRFFFLGFFVKCLNSHQNFHLQQVLFKFHLNKKKSTHIRTRAPNSHRTFTERTHSTHTTRTCGRMCVPVLSCWAPKAVRFFICKHLTVLLTHLYSYPLSTKNTHAHSIKLTMFTIKSSTVF